MHAVSLAENSCTFSLQVGNNFVIVKKQDDTDLHDLPSLRKLLSHELVLCSYLRGDKAPTWVKSTGLNPNCLQVGQDQRKVQGKKGKQSSM